MRNPYTRNGEWLTEHVRDSGGTDEEILVAALTEVRVVVGDERMTRSTKVKLLRAILDLAPAG